MIRKILYWIFTILMALGYGSGAYFDLTQPQIVVDGANHLGYPLYFFTILGVWKALAVVAILAPGLPRLKEWAYAGCFFNLTGAIATHAFVHDPFSDYLPSMALLAYTVISYCLRPASRRLPGPCL
jgi:hypothetical protein